VRDSFVHSMKFGKYKHYKGKQYEVLGVVLHTETQEKMVLYRALYNCPDLYEEYGKNPFFVRPYEMFNEQVEVDNKLIPRFVYIGYILDKEK